MNQGNRAEQAAVLATISNHGPIPYPEIVRRTGLSRRTVEQAVEDVRLAGQPVCSGSAGLWIAADAADALATVAALSRRARTQLRTLSALKRTARRMRDREQGTERLGLWA